MSVYNYSHWGRLLEAEFLTSLIPELMAVCEYLWSFDAVHHDDTVISQHR